MFVKERFQWCYMHANKRAVQTLITFSFFFFQQLLVTFNNDVSKKDAQGGISKANLLKEIGNISW